MSVILKNTMPPIIEIAKLGYAAVAVYSLLYQSAYQDERYALKNPWDGQTEETAVEQQIGLTQQLLGPLAWENKR